MEAKFPLWTAGGEGCDCTLWGHLCPLSRDTHLDSWHCLALFLLRDLNTQTQTETVTTNVSSCKRNCGTFKLHRLQAAPLEARV